MPKVHITETVLRDGHQSLIATRMRTEDMLPACKKLDDAGYWSLEVWGGATFDACVRFLKEDPWERLRSLRQALPNTRLQIVIILMMWLKNLCKKQQTMASMYSGYLMHLMIFAIWKSPLKRLNRQANMPRGPLVTPPVQCTILKVLSPWPGNLKPWAVTVLP